MPTGWLRSLQCKSRVLEDVYQPNPKTLNHLLPISSCRKSVQSLKDVVETTKAKPRKTNPFSSPLQPSSRNLRKPTKTDRATDPFFTELPEGHPSRNVVEIIFHTSWSPKEFLGRIEMIFKVQNKPKTVARFEEYREMVKSRAGSGNSGSSSREDDARCSADGNEVMRFHCLGHTAGRNYDAGGMCMFSGKDAVTCTFSSSGGAHESAGGGKGRRAMLVCRVIAGRVCKKLGLESFLEGRVGLDSVSEENGKLLVFDSRAVLPCFLIIYKL